MGGQDHLSHRLVALGLTPGAAVGVLVAVEAWVALLAVLIGRQVDLPARIASVAAGATFAALSAVTVRAALRRARPRHVSPGTAPRRRGGRNRHPPGRPGGHRPDARPTGRAPPAPGRRVRRSMPSPPATAGGRRCCWGRRHSTCGRRTPPCRGRSALSVCWSRASGPTWRRRGRWWMRAGRSSAPPRRSRLRQKHPRCRWADDRSFAAASRIWPRPCPMRPRPPPVVRQSRRLQPPVSVAAARRHGSDAPGAAGRGRRGGGPGRRPDAVPSLACSATPAPGDTSSPYRTTPSSGAPVASSTTGASSSPRDGRLRLTRLAPDQRARHVRVARPPAMCRQEVHRPLPELRRGGNLAEHQRLA